MTDREKVIRGLEFHKKVWDNALSYRCENEFGIRCPYEECRPGCTRALAVDALALLNEQEPKMVVQTTSTIRCPGCGKQITSKGALHKEIKYCWKCGQAVKWDD